jgi:hypothetical protein
VAAHATKPSSALFKHTAPFRLVRSVRYAPEPEVRTQGINHIDEQPLYRFPDLPRLENFSVKTRILNTLVYNVFVAVLGSMTAISHLIFDLPGLNDAILNT